MTGWEVGRTMCTAYPTSAPPTGVSSPMPPHSQGAERRPERRASRTGSRWALRTLVIGGLAGVAWLLTGAAAHAADRDPAPEGLLGSSLIGAVVDGEAAPPAVGKVLKAAAQPLESDRTSDTHHVASSVLAAPARALARPAEVLTETLDEATQQGTAVDTVVRHLSGPLRLTGGPADAQPFPSVAPLTRTLSQVTDLLQHPSGPVAEYQAPASAAGDAVATRPAHTGVAHTVPITGVAGDRDDARATGSVSKRLPIVTGRHQTAVTAAAPGTVRGFTSGGDGPTPRQVYPGAFSGISTSLSGAQAEGGSAAVLPAAVGVGTVASHRLPHATDVEVRRHDAEAPTVSPD